MADRTKAKELFIAALDHPDAERGAYLARACGNDAALRLEVEELLAALADRPVLDTAPYRAGRSRSPEAAQGEGPGTRIGRYKLLQLIGEGGFGAVFMAEQERPVRRRVALKIIKLGMDTRQVVARFEQERQALAMMDHPHIAKVLDAGATQTGRPYFVMELVRGDPITAYCDTNNLPHAERLALFVQVCNAVQHAHQKGIIHRDLKPSNILITVADGRPIPKVIDFGIAKATGAAGRLTDKTLFTEFRQLIGTPEYMSPEQAEMSGVDIDTRSDVYSLGVLLYELLTGERPFDLRHSSLDEMRRIIREVEPPRPSTRLSGLIQPRSHSEPRDSSRALAARDVKVATLAGASSVIEIARHRRTVPATLVRSLRGDLDWIVMKCLEKDRTRRYETASGLASDVQRHLSGEPVVAAPPGTWYRARKFVRRNKGAVLAGELVAAALIIGISVSTWMFLRERDARARAVDAEQTQGQLRLQAEADEKQAKTEAAKSQQVAQFLKDMLKGVEPSVAMGRDTTMLREILDKTAERVDKDLADQPEVQIELRLALADIYHELGMFKRMEAMARGTLELARSNLGEENLAVADALVQLGDALMHLRAYGESEAALREAIVMQRTLRGSESLQLAEALYALAHAIGPQGKDAETESVCREALAMRRRLLGNEHAKVARALDSLGNMLRHRGRLAEAESTMRESLAMRRNVLGNDHPDLGRSYSSLGALLIEQGRLGEAEAMYREALASQSTTPGQESWLSVWTIHGLANILRTQGQPAEAEDLLRRGLPIARRQMGDEHSTTGKLVLDLADVLREEGKYAEAEILYRQLLPPARNTTVEDHSLVARAYNNLSDVLLALKRPDESEQALHEAITVLKSAMAEFPDQRQSLLESQAHDYRLLAFRYWNRRNYSGARELFAVATDLFRQSAEAGGPKATATALQGEADNFLCIGQLWEAESRSAEANEAYRQALALQERIEQEERAQDITAGWVAEHYIQLARLVEKVATREDALRIAQVLHSPKRELSPNALNGLMNCHFQLATVLQRHGSTEEAIQQLEHLRGKLPADDSLSLRAEFNVASILRQGGKLAEASQVCLQATQKCHEVLPQYEKLAADPTRHHDCWSFAIAYEQIAQLLNELGRHQEAELGYRDAQAIWIKLVADSNIEDDRWHLAVNHDALGHLLRDSGRLDEAAGSYRDALAIWEKLAAETNNIDRHNHLSWTRIALAEVLMALGDNAAAEALATQLIQQAELADNADQLANAYARAIPLLMISQRQDQARDLGRKLLALTPTNGQPANGAAWFLATAENPACRDAALAVELANKAVELDPTRASWWNTLGAARYRAGDFQQAVTDLETSIQLSNGGSSFDFFFLAMAYWQLGEDSEARTWYDKAVEWMDKNQPTHEELRRFRAEAAELMAEHSPAHDSEHLEPPHE